MTQYARPSSDVSNAGWEDATGGDGDALLWDELDESTADDATTFIRSNTALEVCEVSLGAISDPGVDTGHVMRIRGRSTASGTRRRITFELYQGAVLIDTKIVTMLATWTTFSLTILAVIAAQITDYADLRFRFTSAVGAGETTDITWAELETPGEPPSAPSVTDIGDSYFAAKFRREAAIWLDISSR